MRKSLFILLMAIVVILPSKVWAAVGSVSISCAPATVKAGESFECNITGISDVEIMDVSAEIYLDDNLTMVSFELNDIWEGSDFDTGKIDIYTKSGEPVKSEFNIGTMSVKVKDGVVNTVETVRLRNVEFTYDKNEYIIDNATAYIRVPNNVNTLASLTVSGATFTFDENITIYNLVVDAESTTIIAAGKDDKAKVIGDVGNKLLNYGLNTFTITVTAEDGSKKNYILNITRPDNRSKENNLLSFEFNGYNIEFDKDITEYSLELEHDASRIGFCDKDSKKDDLLCIDLDSFVISYKAISSMYLNDINVGKKYVELENKITKECDENDNCIYYLDKEVVGKSDGEIEQWYIPIYELNVGKNVLKVIVTAENETKKTYTFNISRKNKQGNLVDNGVPSSPDTGDSLIIVIFIVAVLAFGITVYFFIRRNKGLH